MANTWAEYDLNEHESRMEEYKKKCPVCDVCNEPITWTDYYYEIDDRIICPNCIVDYRKSVESFIDRR